MSIPVVSSMPPAPSRGDAPDLFESRMDAHLAALAGLVSDVNAAIVWMNTAYQLVPMAQESLALVSSYTARHQGGHASAPAARNDGSALQPGDLYFNTAGSVTYAWSGSAWGIFVPSGRFKIVTLGETQTADYVGGIGESVQIEKASAALRVLFPAAAVPGDIFRVVNATDREDHVLNGNGAPVQGSSIDINYSIRKCGMTFENVGSAGWRAM